MNSNEISPDFEPQAPTGKLKALPESALKVTVAVRKVAANMRPDTPSDPQANTPTMQWKTPSTIRKVNPLLRIIKIIDPIEKRFNPNVSLPEGIGWAEIKEALIADPEGLSAVEAMEQGHEPNVWFADKDGFIIGTYSINAPKIGRHMDYISAESAAKAMKTDIPTEEQYRKLQESGGFDPPENWCWLKQDADAKKIGEAPQGRRGNINGELKVQIYKRVDTYESKNGSLRVVRKFKWTDRVAKLFPRTVQYGQ